MTVLDTVCAQDTVTCEKHKSGYHLENNCKSLWAKWFTNYILYVLCRHVEVLNIAQHCPGVDGLTGHKTN